MLNGDTLFTRIQGIPCQIRVTQFSHQEPLGPWCDSDLDCYGYTDIDFEVLVRRGYLAPWLSRKMTQDDVRNIEMEIEDRFNDPRHY